LRVEKAEEPQHPVAHAWELEFVRLIALPATSPLASEQQWWQDLVQEGPKDRVRENALHADRGTVQDAMFSLTLDPNHIVQAGGAICK
jgi:hypothetical protein